MIWIRCNYHHKTVVVENVNQKDIRDFDNAFIERSVDCATFQTVILPTYLSPSAVTIYPKKKKKDVGTEQAAGTNDDKNRS